MSKAVIMGSATKENLLTRVEKVENVVNINNHLTSTTIIGGNSWYRIATGSMHLSGTILSITLRFVAYANSSGNIGFICDKLTASLSQDQRCSIKWTWDSVVPLTNENEMLSESITGEESETGCKMEISVSSSSNGESAPDFYLNIPAGVTDLGCVILPFYKYFGYSKQDIRSDIMGSVREDSFAMHNKTFDDSNTFPDTLATTDTVDTKVKKAIQDLGAVVTEDDEQTLTNKEIDSNNCYFSQRGFSVKNGDDTWRVYLPNSGDHMNLVDADTAQTIENKTFKKNNKFPEEIVTESGLKLVVQTIVDLVNGLGGYTVATSKQVEDLEARVKALEDAANGTEE